MARRKKYDFQPDKTGAGLLSKLYITRLQRLKLLRWTLLAVLLVVLSVVQDVILCKLSVFGATTDLVPCTIILICVHLGAEKSCVFALIASAVYKFTGTSPGYYVIALIPLLGVLAAALRQNFFRRSLSSILLCACVAVMVYEMAVFGFGVLFQSTVPDKVLRFVIRGGLSLLSYPATYPLTKAITKIGETSWKD